MSKELQNRTDDRSSAQRTDEIAAKEFNFEIWAWGYTRFAEPGSSQVANGRESPVGRVAIGKRTLVEETYAAAPKQSFDDCQVRALRDVVARLGSNPALQEAMLACADPWIVERATERSIEHSEPARVATPHGRAMWGATRAHAATLYRRVKAAGMGARDTPEVTTALDAIGSGMPLPDDVRERMEAIVGETMENVRLHTGPVAAAACEAVNAEAFTAGQDIFYPGFDPASPASLKTLAHECMHVKQWQQGLITPVQDGLAVSDPSDVLEQQAEAVAERAFREPTFADAMQRRELPEPGLRGGHPPHAGWVEPLTSMASPPGVHDRAEPRIGGADGTVLLRKPMRYEAPRATPGNSDEKPVELPRGKNLQVQQDGSVILRAQWIRDDRHYAVEVGEGGNELVAAPGCMSEILRQLKSTLLPWIQTSQIPKLSQELKIIGPPTDRAFYTVHVAFDVYERIGPPPNREVVFTKHGDGLSGVIEESLVIPGGVKANTKIAVSEDVRQTVLARLEAYTDLALPPDVGARAIAGEHNKTWNFTVSPGARGVLFRLSREFLEQLYTKPVWASYLQQRPKPHSNKESAPAAAAGGLSFAGDVPANERAYVEKWLERLNSGRAASVHAAGHMFVTSELVEKLHEIDKDPNNKQIIARLMATGGRGRAQPLDVAELDRVMKTVEYEVARATLHLDPPPQGANPLFDESVRGEIRNRGSANYVGQQTAFTFETHNHSDAFAIPDLTVRWVVTEFGKTEPLANQVTRSIDISTEKPDYFEYKWPKPGIYTVHAFVSHSFYRPRYKHANVVVKTEAERNRELTQPAFQGLEGATHYATDEHRFRASATNTAVNTAVGAIGTAISGPIGTAIGTALESDPHSVGRMTRGQVAEGYQQPSFEQRTEFLTNEQRQLEDMRAAHKDSTDPQWKDANEYANHELANVNSTLATLRAENKDAIFFDARGTYLSRENDIPSAVLTLVAFAKFSDSDVNVILHDLSKVGGQVYQTFRGTGKNFEQAVEDAYFDLAKAYPPGRVSALFEVVNDQAKGTGATIGYECDTGTAWKSLKSAIYNPHVQLAVNIVGAAAMVFLPMTAPVLIPVLGGYNSLDTLDHMRDQHVRGNLTAGEVVRDTAQIGLNFIPYLNELRPIKNAGKAGLYVLHGAVIADQVVAVTEHGFTELNRIHDDNIVPIAKLDAEIRERERLNRGDPELPKLREDLAAKIREAQTAWKGVAADAVKNFAIMAAQMAGTHALHVHVAAKRLRKLVAQGIVQIEPDVIPRYNEATATMVGDESKLDPQTVAKLQGVYQKDLVAKRLQLEVVLGSKAVEIVRTEGPSRIARSGDGWRVELSTREPFGTVLGEAQRIAQARGNGAPTGSDAANPVVLVGTRASPATSGEAHPKESAAHGSTEQDVEPSEDFEPPEHTAPARHDVRVRAIQASEAELSRRLGAKVVFDEALSTGVKVQVQRVERVLGFDLEVDTVRVGKEALLSDVLAHGATIQRIRRYNGIVWRLRQLADRFAVWTGQRPAAKFPRGSRGWVTQEELTKLDELMTQRHGEFGMGTVDPHTLSEEIEFLSGRHAYHEEVLRSLDDFGGAFDGDFTVAATGTGEVTTQALAAGYQLPTDNPEFYYFRNKRSNPKEYELALKPYSDGKAKSFRAITEDGKFVRLEEWEPPKRVPIPRDMSQRDVVAALRQADGFQEYAEMLERTGLATQNEIDEVVGRVHTEKKESGDPVYFDTVRHEAKEHFRPRVRERLLNPALSNEASWRQMRDMTETLGVSDRGALAEDWYRGRYVPNADPRVSVGVTRSSGPNAGNIEARVIDMVDGNTAVEIKDIVDKVNPEQLGAYLDMLEQQLSVGKNGKEPPKIKKVKYVFTNPEGAIANLKSFAKLLANPDRANRLSVEVFDWQGRRHLVTTKAEALELLDLLTPAGTPL